MKKIECTLRTVDLLHVGSGEVSMGHHGIVAVQKLHDKPFIPGSTLRGNIRANMKRILRGLRTCAKGHLKDFFEEFKKDSQVLRYIFGGPDYQGLVIISGGKTDQNANINVIPGVRLDQARRSTATGALFFYEAVPPGTEFAFTVFLQSTGKRQAAYQDVIYFLILLAIQQMEHSGLGRHRTHVELEFPRQELEQMAEEMIVNE